MFGLASRTPWVRIETRARNAVTTLWPDAEHTRVRKGSIARGADAMMFGPHTAKLLRAALGTGIDARASRDAGSYLCNYLSWRAIEAIDAMTRSAPCRLRACAAARARRRSATQGASARITLEHLVDAGEAMLLEMVKLTTASACGRERHPEEPRSGASTDEPRARRFRSLRWWARRCAHLADPSRHAGMSHASF